MKLGHDTNDVAIALKGDLVCRLQPLPKRATRTDAAAAEARDLNISGQQLYIARGDPSMARVDFDIV